MTPISPLPDGYRTVVVPRDRLQELVDVDRLAFAMTTTPETDAIVPITLEDGRMMAVEASDGRFPAGPASFEFPLPVPGGEVACAGLTWVGARPDERRKGLLTSMMGTHVERSLARGEVVSALWAAEPAIYGRYGYGSAADGLHLTVGRGAALRPVAGTEELTVRFDTLDAERDGELVDGVHRAAGA